jgi:hypothetical protein
MHGAITTGEFFPAVLGALDVVGGTVAPHPPYWRLPTLQTGPFCTALLAALNKHDERTWSLTAAAGRNENTGAAARRGISRPVIFEFVAIDLTECGIAIDHSSP